jgi:hypothetical protein
MQNDEVTITLGGQSSNGIVETLLVINDFIEVVGRNNKLHHEKFSLELEKAKEHITKALTEDCP